MQLRYEIIFARLFQYKTVFTLYILQIYQFDQCLFFLQQDNSLKDFYRPQEKATDGNFRWKVYDTFSKKMSYF